MMNKKIKKVFKSLDPDVQEAIKFLINEIQVKREIKKLKKVKKKLDSYSILSLYYSR